jgi:hypothetical protein
MTTYATMRTRIADNLIDTGGLTTSQINEAIQSAIKHYERKTFYFNQKVDGTFPTVAAQEYYTSADFADIPNIVKVRSANVTINGSKSPLKPFDFQVIDDEQDGSVTGDPYAYASFAQKIRLYPIPNGAFTVKMSYVYKLAALSADGDTNAWMTDAEEMIRQAAKKRIAIDILHDDELAGRCTVLEVEAYDELMAETARRLPNTELKIPAMLGQSSFDIQRGY